MQISRIGSVNFGYSEAYYQTQKHPKTFYERKGVGGNGEKLDIIFDMLQQAAKERKILAQNQAKMHFANMYACKGLCQDNYYSKATPVREAFEDVKIKQL